MVSSSVTHHGAFVAQNTHELTIHVPTNPVSICAVTVINHHRDAVTPNPQGCCPDKSKVAVAGLYEIVVLGW